MFEFEWIYIFALAPLPALFYWLMPTAKQTGSAIVTPFIQHNITSAKITGHSINLLSANLWFLLIAWLLLLASISRPIWVGDLVKLPQQGKDVILAVDLSGSMQRADFSYSGRRLNRLQVVKIAANKFIDKRKKDRIGLVVFGSQAYLYAPLTFDTQLIKQLLNQSQIAMAGDQTAIGDSIAMAIKHFREVNKDNKKEKILILLTDGSNTSGVISVQKAVDLAKIENLKIYTIGLGAKQQRNRWMFRSGNGIDEATLKSIAKQTNGKYFRATNTKALQQIYDALDKLETSKENQKTFRPKKDLFYYPLTAFFVIIMLLLLLRLKQ